MPDLSDPLALEEFESELDNLLRRAALTIVEDHRDVLEGTDDVDTALHDDVNELAQILRDRADETERLIYDDSYTGPYGSQAD